MKYAKLTGLKDVIVLSGNTHPQVESLKLREILGRW